MTTGSGADGAGDQVRRVGAPLGIGIFMMPYIFAWLLLRRGYSRQARFLAFGWLGVLVLLTVIVGNDGASKSFTPAPGVTIPSASDQRSFSQSVTDAVVDPQMNALTDKVARDAVDEYKITLSGGDKIEICVQAGMVAAAYKQAKDEANYLLWKQKERNDCQDAGMPQH